MTKEMPKLGRLSLEMMYQTSGTQINLDYSDEKNFSSKFKLISYLVPISIALFANSSIKKKNFAIICHIDHMFGRTHLEADYQNYF